MQTIPHFQCLQHLTGLVSCISSPWALLMLPLSISNATIVMGGILTTTIKSPGFLVYASLGCGSHEYSKPLESHQKNAEWNAVTIPENFTVRNDWGCGLHLESLHDITLFRKDEQLPCSLNTSWGRSNTCWATSVLKWTLHWWTSTHGGWGLFSWWPRLVVTPDNSLHVSNNRHFCPCCPWVDGWSPSC